MTIGSAFVTKNLEGRISREDYDRFPFRISDRQTGALPDFHLPVDCFKWGDHTPTISNTHTEILTAALFHVGVPRFHGTQREGND